MKEVKCEVTQLIVQAFSVSWPTAELLERVTLHKLGSNMVWNIR